MNHECNKTQEALAAYVDGENASLQGAEVQQHLTLCEDCQALYGEIEHALSMPGPDESTKTPSPDGEAAYFSAEPDAQYWASLAGRIMERIAANTQRTEGTGRASDGAHPVTGRQTQTQGKVVPLKLWPRQVARFLGEPGMRPVMALAAVIVLAVLVTRSLYISSLSPSRSKVLPYEGPIAPQSEPAAQEEKTSTPPEGLSGQPTPSEKSRASADAPAARTREATPATAVPAAQPDGRSTKTELAAAQQQAEVAQAGDVAIQESREQAADVSGAASRVAVGLAQQPEKGAAKLGAAEPSAMPRAVPENTFAQALWRAQHARTPAQQQEIWENFLATAADSSYVHLAIFHLAQSLAAQIDSTSSGAQLHSTLNFYQDNEAVLRPLLGTEKFGAEIRRLQTLQSKKIDNK